PLSYKSSSLSVSSVLSPSSSAFIASQSLRQCYPSQTRSFHISQTVLARRSPSRRQEADSEEPSATSLAIADEALESLFGSNKAGSRKSRSKSSSQNNRIDEIEESDMDRDHVDWSDAVEHRQDKRSKKSFSEHDLEELDSSIDNRKSTMKSKSWQRDDLADLGDEETEAIKAMPIPPQPTFDRPPKPSIKKEPTFDSIDDITTTTDKETAKPKFKEVARDPRKEQARLEAREMIDELYEAAENEREMESRRLSRRAKATSEKTSVSSTT
ncbi:hypothetical protein HDU76_011147, partial [Blyttiomyces sp. JEL0837]